MRHVGSTGECCHASIGKAQGGSGNKGLGGHGESPSGRQDSERPMDPGARYGGDPGPRLQFWEKGWPFFILLEPEDDVV